MDSVGLDPVVSVSDFDFEVIEHGEDLSQVLSTSREVWVFVNEDQESSNEGSFSCPKEGIASVFTSIEEQTDLLSHSLRSGGVRRGVIQVVSH